jgi:UDP-N-acetylglucosamine 4,6-dehydratase
MSKSASDSTLLTIEIESICLSSQFIKEVLPKNTDLNPHHLQILGYCCTRALRVQRLLRVTNPLEKQIRYWIGVRLGNQDWCFEGTELSGGNALSKLDNSSVLITGATGSLGKALVKHLLTDTKVRRIAIYSRDELKQMQVRELFNNDPRLRWFLGDIRDLPRLNRALHGIDYVIHAAALKQVDTGEYNPMEFVKTNVLGSQNVIEACIDSGVKQVVALSTDKASSPINLYGATKLTADKLFIAANNYSHAYGTSFAVVRYGNVMGSRGSVIPYFRKLAEEGKDLPLTDLRMTRFWISLDQAVKFVMDSFDLMQGGELYVPRIPSVKLIDLAYAVAPTARTKEVGMRPGEKLHEEMISLDDARRTYLLGERYIVAPVMAEWGFKIPDDAKAVQDGFCYRSDNNEYWLSIQEISAMIDYIE